MKTILFVANIDEHIRAFHLPYLEFFKNSGWQVCVAARGNAAFDCADIKYDIPLERSPFRLKNIRAFFTLYRIFKKSRFDIVHFHTDTVHVIGLFALLAAGKKGARVLFTSHGHYYSRGSPLLHWLLYFPIDTLLARFTDCLITINHEDFTLSKRYQKAGRVEYVHGVGVDTGSIRIADAAARAESRRKFGYGASSFIIFYAAEFTANKNQRLLIQTVSLLKDSLPQIRLLLAGYDSGCLESCRKLAENLGLSEQVEFLGYRIDIPVLLSACDAVTASSRKEGLPMNIMEAMAGGVPVVATDNRGHRELIKDGVNGFLTVSREPREMAKNILRLCLNPFIAERFRAQNRQLISKYSIEAVFKEMREIYCRYM